MAEVPLVDTFIKPSGHHRRHLLRPTTQRTRYTIYAPSPAVPRRSLLYQQVADQATRVRRCPQTSWLGLFASRGSWVRVPSSPPG